MGGRERVAGTRRRGRSWPLSGPSWPGVGALPRGCRGPDLGSARGYSREMAEGIVKRHSQGCPARLGGRCRCKAGYEAFVYSARDGKKLRKTFARLAEAKSWRAEAKRSVDHGTLRAPTRRTLGEAAAEWLLGAEAGDVRNRSGQPYKPATLRGYRQALEDYLLPVLGGRKLNTVTTADLQELVDRWQAEGRRRRRSATRSSRCRRFTGEPGRGKGCRSTRPATWNCRRRRRRRSRSSRPRWRRSC